MNDIFIFVYLFWFKYRILTACCSAIRPNKFNYNFLQLMCLIDSFFQNKWSYKTVIYITIYNLQNSLELFL